MRERGGTKKEKVRKEIDEKKERVRKVKCLIKRECNTQRNERKRMIDI